MILTKAHVFLVFFGATVVNAQTATDPPAPSGTASISPCVMSCLSDAVTSSGCSSLTNLSCVCSSSAFNSAIAACLEQNCTPEEIAEALALRQASCGATSPPGDTGPSSSGTASSTPTTVIPTTSPPTSTKTTTTPSTTSTGTATQTSTTSDSTTTATGTSPPSTSNAAAGQGQTVFGGLGALVAEMMWLVF